MTETATLARRLANFRGDDAARRSRPNGQIARASSTAHGRSRSTELAHRLAAALDAEVVGTPLGSVVRVETAARALSLDREVLSRLPGQPPASIPLVCLDTETTGLATAAGTVAFLVGLGWWEGVRFRQVQLLLPDQPDEPALLDMLSSMIPAHAWLVTYNGRGFDWPLLVARFRMARRDAPPHAGHLDLLSTVRRLFRHRMADARLRTAEEALLGIRRVDDVEGWEIPGRYLSFLRGGDPRQLVPVVEHNDRDVRSLACLLAHLAEQLGDQDRRRTAPDGDLLGLARTFQREGRLEEALQCLDMAVQRPLRPAGRLTRDQLAHERARLLRRLGRPGEARRAWQALAGRNGPLAAVAYVELAKILEHIERDFPAALDAVASADRLASQSAAIGRPVPGLLADLRRRRTRLLRRAADDRDPAPAPLRARTRQPHALAHALANG